MSKNARSRIMASIRSKNTLPELIVRSELHQRGFRFRTHDKSLPGTPDIVLRRYKTVIWVQGCFWHRHKRCRAGELPATNRKYWVPKLEGNAERDKKTKQALSQIGWVTIAIWECQVFDNKKLEKMMQKTENRLRLRLYELKKARA
ncbi:MAG: DNA mismatch endonuclease Vsr [Acidobacteriales bacterium]|nr:DNA mismatch endonuclease Vsr [Terriglobales bacterium]